jgi:GTP-binding protein
MDVLYGDDADAVIAKLKETFEPKGITVFPISAVSGKGVKELLYHVKGMLGSLDQTPVVFEREFFPEDMAETNEPYTVSKEEDHVYVIEGPRIERMLGYTNLDSEKGFRFFRTSLRTTAYLTSWRLSG